MKYSVIIPFYNTEEYIEECINSVIQQNRDDVELILINDGSTDNSLLKCQKITEKYENKIIIDKPNTGSMDSWIQGVNASKGEYICFIDADDKIASNYFNIIDKYIDMQFDIIIYDYYKYYNNSIYGIKANSIEYGEINDLDLKEIRLDFFYNFEKISSYRWNKVFKSDFLKKNIEEVEVRCSSFEDHLIGFLNIINAKRIYYLNEKLYYYRMRKSSISHSYNNKVFGENRKIEANIIKIAKNNNYSDTGINNIKLHFLYQYARYYLKSKNKIKKDKKVCWEDISNIRGINKKIVLLLYKFNLKNVYIVINKIKNQNRNAYFD